MNKLSEVIEQAKQDCILTGCSRIELNNNIKIYADWVTIEKDNKDFDIVEIIIIENGICKFKYQLEDKLEFLREQSKGSNTRYITLKILADLDFIIPPLTKQVEFEKFCNHVDKLKFEVQKSLDESKNLFNSLMQEYFG